MKKKLILSAVSLLVAFQFIATVAVAKIIKVNRSGVGDFTTIQEAINAASPGDVIKVGPGVYNENIVINKKLELIGSGATKWIPQPPVGSIGILRPPELIEKNPPIGPGPVETIPPELINPISGPILYKTLSQNTRLRENMAISSPIPLSTGLVFQPPVITLPPSTGSIGELPIEIPYSGKIYTGPSLTIKPYPLPILITGSVIQGNGSDHVVKVSNVTAGRIEGFSITNSGPQHAGIYLSNSSITVVNNRFTKNKDGLLASNSASIIQNNVFDDNGYSDNPVTDYGICCLKSILSINNNLVINNEEVGIYVAWTESSGTEIVNNTIIGNAYDGIWCYRTSPTIKNNIITENGYGICASYYSTPAISYNDVWSNGENYNQQSGGAAAPGTGDISSDPLFVDANQGDYHLLEDSACIDSGDPKPVYNDPDGSRNDMGAYGGFGGSEGVSTWEGSGFMFTDIGNLPVAYIPQDKNDPSFGLAKVSSSAAAKLKIPQWVDAPFGGKLRIFGQFGSESTDYVYYYQILIARWDGNTEPSDNDFVPLNDPLTKVRYVFDSQTQKVTHQVISLGPKMRGSRTSLYELNKGDYWSQRDLRLILNTRTWPNGKYSLRYKAFNQIGQPLSPPLPSNSQDHLTIIINNSPVTAKIHWVKYDALNPHYEPAVDGNIPECGVIHLQNEQENLRFVITASHPEGYLDHYVLDCLWGKNKYGGTIQYETYTNATPASPHLWNGVTQMEFSLPNNWPGWNTCAYQFRLRAYSRTTDGQHAYLYRSEFNDHYTIEIGPGSSTSTGLPGDLNNDGQVTIDELTKVINAFLGK